jgi:Protein DA1
MDTGDCQPLYHSIRDYYEGMNMRIDQQIPMLLVERQALNDAMEGEKDVCNKAIHVFVISFSLSLPHHN